MWIWPDLSSYTNITWNGTGIKRDLKVGPVRSQLNHVGKYRGSRYKQIPVSSKTGHSYSCFDNMAMRLFKGAKSSSRHILGLKIALLPYVPYGSNGLN